MAVHIVYIFDERYSIYSSISAISAVKFAKEKLIFHCIGPKDSETGLDKFYDELSAHGQEVHCHSCDTNHGSFKALRGQKANHLKYLIPEVIEEKKALYVDGDTLFQNCPSEIFNIDLTEKSVAGVCDYSHLPSKQKNWPTKIRFSSKEEVYINSGMMLLNLERIRNMNIAQKASEINEALGSKVVFADQDILNLVFEGQKKIIAPQFNFQIFNGNVSQDIWKKITTSKSLKLVLIHFIGWSKPWMKCCNPLIVGDYLSYGRKLKTMQLHLEDIQNVRHQIQYAKMLDLCQRFQEASAIKQKIINRLMRRIDEIKKNS